MIEDTTAPVKQSHENVINLMEALRHGLAAERSSKPCLSGEVKGNNFFALVANFGAPKKFRTRLSSGGQEMRTSWQLP